MKSLPLLSLLALAACASAPDAAFKASPTQYGLYVASTNLYVDVPLTVKRADSGALFQIPVKHMGGDETGYLMASLPPGRYLLDSYSPTGGKAVALSTGNGYFDVQADCFNYGGRYDFTLDPTVPYSNVSRIKDIEQLPEQYRRLAAGHDVCSAAMGQANDRIAYADIKDLLSL
ncbi:MAG TPA: hypothetical protein VLG68_01085 [Gammaproteobacteria bacterium]|nr:hypothetical protein [Gammaproteobacteria bacterium]